MIDTSNLNKVAKIIIECFIDSGFDDAYIHSKIERLQDLDMWQTAFWATHQLDSSNKAKFANKVGVTPKDLMISFETIRKIQFFGE